ncbi:ATP-binding protein [Pseudoduganella sp. GCM10020061]|uniref:ATP-binding protein n=1 Tax=Pseudoduganella sp. GCM10020061 TaxID=3317345 RepID=UPI00362C309B
MTQALSEHITRALTGCDQEPISFPGAIQPHGFLLALHGGAVVQASANFERQAGRPLAGVLDRPLADAVGAEAATLLAPELEPDRLRERPSYAGTVALDGRHYDVLAHACDQLVLLEFEEVHGRPPAQFRHLYSTIADFMLKLNDVDSIEAMSTVAASEMRRVTGFGRVLVYRFDAEGHGHVLAECRDEHHPSYLGHRFPAADIPQQARALYARNHIRLIRDAAYEPSPLVPPMNPVTGKANDLSFAALRSVSPVHLQYMRNMGTYASMSVSLMVQGQLWGLISCHNEQPCDVPFDKRTACEQIGQLLALRIESREVAEDLQFRLEVRRSMVSMLASLTKGEDFLDNMRGIFPELLRFARADGVAIVMGDREACSGNTPSAAQVRELVQWLDANGHQDIFHTDRLSEVYPPAAQFTAQASGVLAMPVSRIHKHYLLWFRPERISTIEWAGNPHAKAGAGGQLSPRTSFETWRETVRATSAPWHPAELELALEFRTALLGIALERAEQMAELATELGRANKELEAFSYSVSHDLRAPLRHIVGFSDLLLETGDQADPARRARFLNNIKDSARLAGKLVDDLLSFSQMGRAALRPVRIEMGELVRGCIERMGPDLQGRAIEWQVEPLPAVEADPSFLHLAVYNLLANAVKFTARREPARIRVWSEQDGANFIFHVADNGVGFNMDYAHKLFGVFQRLHRMEDFGGTGIGLANVRRIVERHGGTVRAVGAPDRGATFSFTIPKQLPL